MKCRHLVSFTQSCFLTVDYDVYRMSHAHFSHFSLTTEMDYSLDSTYYRTFNIWENLNSNL